MDYQRQDVMDNNHDWIDYFSYFPNMWKFLKASSFSEIGLCVLYTVESRFILCTFYSIGEEILRGVIEYKLSFTTRRLRPVVQRYACLLKCDTANRSTVPKNQPSRGGILWRQAVPL
jgi:hypothetical protein